MKKVWKINTTQDHIKAQCVLLAPSSSAAAASAVVEEVMAVLS